MRCFFFELDGCLRRIGVRGIVCACLTTTAFGLVSKIGCSCTNWFADDGSNDRITNSIFIFGSPALQHGYAMFWMRTAELLDEICPLWELDVAGIDFYWSHRCIQYVLRYSSKCWYRSLSTGMFPWVISVAAVCRCQADDVFAEVAKDASSDYPDRKRTTKVQQIQQLVGRSENQFKQSQMCTWLLLDPTTHQTPNIQNHRDKIATHNNATQAVILKTDAKAAAIQTTPYQLTIAKVSRYGRDGYQEFSRWCHSQSKTTVYFCASSSNPRCCAISKFQIRVLEKMLFEPPWLRRDLSFLIHVWN